MTTANSLGGLVSNFINWCGKVPNYNSLGDLVYFIQKKKRRKEKEVTTTNTNHVHANVNPSQEHV